MPNKTSKARQAVNYKYPFISAMGHLDEMLLG